MRLLDLYTAECILLTRIRTEDPAGGYNLDWQDDAHFNAAWEYQSAPEIVVAEQQGVNRVYRIYVDKTLELDYHEVFRRADDSQTYRVINPGTDRITPTTSRLNRRLIEVEKYPLPREEE